MFGTQVTTIVVMIMCVQTLLIIQVQMLMDPRVTGYGTVPARMWEPYVLTAVITMMMALTVLQMVAHLHHLSVPAEQPVRTMTDSFFNQ